MNYEDVPDSCWQALSNAVIVQAAKDYRNTLRRIKRMRNSDDKVLLGQQRKLENFFRSGWFSVLCSLDGRTVITRIRKEVGV